MKQLLKKLKTNKKLLTAILMITLLLGLITSVSFAAYNFINDAEDNAMNLGQVSMTYTEPSNEVILKDALPKKDELGKNQEEYFEFSVMSHATTNTDDDNGVTIPYEISISKVEVGASKKELQDNQVKIYLTRLDGVSEIDVLNPTLVSNLKQSDYDSNGYKVYDGSDAHSNNSDSKTTKYRIRFWVDENVDVSNWATTNEYEYKFKVNVNAKANKETNSSITLSKAIKSMYTLDNGTAKVEDGYYYLTGMEELDDLSKEQEALAQFGGGANVYYYRRADGTFDANQLEADLKNYMINANGVSEEEWNQVTGPFGGYLNAILGMVYGVVTEDMEYAEGKTIDDIPTLDEAMADETMKLNIIEFMADITYDIAAYTPSTFQKLYSDGTSINEELLNENLTLGAEAFGASDMISIMNANFGSISNYAIAEAYEMVDYDDNDIPILAEGKTVDDIPTLDELFLNYTGPILITNNYVRLNNLLYEVIGINSDNTVKLLLVDSIRSITRNFSGYLGIGEKNESSSAYLSLMKDTTLSEIIQKKDYKYFIDNEAKYINSYVSLLTKEEIEKSNVEYRYSFLIDQLKDRYAPVANRENEKQIYYDYDDFDTYSYNPYAIVPTITIEDIKVEGEGTKANPYYIKDEKIVSDLNVAYAINNSLKYNYTDYYSLKWNFASTSPSYLKNTVEHFEKYNLDLENSNMNYTSNGNIFLGLNINGVCYYTNSLGKIYKSEDTGNCEAPEETNVIATKINGEEKTSVDGYLNTEITLSVDKLQEDVTYQWQYRYYENGSTIWKNLVDGDNTLDDDVLTVSGTNTNELKVIPRDSDSSYMEFRCVVNNNLNSKQLTINLKNRIVENLVVSPAPDNNGNLTLYYGDTLNISADVTGSNGYYLEYYKDGEYQNLIEKEITDIGKTTQNISIKIDENFESNTYRLYFKGPRYYSESYSEILYITVKGPSITNQPKNAEVGVGYTTTLKVNAKGAMYYQWQQKIGDEWVNLEDIENKVSGATTDTLKITTTSEMEVITYYRCHLKTIDEVYTNEVTITLFEADEDWKYEKITDSDGIPTGEVNVVEYIGNYEESNSVKVIENYYTMEKAGESGLDVTSNYWHKAQFIEDLVMSPAVYYRVAQEEYGVAEADITVDLIKDLINDRMTIYGYTKRFRDIDWNKYYAGYNNAYDVTLPRSYKGQVVLGATQMLFNREYTAYSYSDNGYESLIEKYINTKETIRNEGLRILNITIPEGYKYIGNDIPAEEFGTGYDYENFSDRDKYPGIYYNNSVFMYLHLLQNINFASTIELIGTGAVYGCGTETLYHNVYLPKNLKKLNAYFMFGASRLKFQEGATIKELTTNNFVLEYMTVALEVPASVERIGAGLHRYYINSDDDVISIFQELTFEDTAERPSQLTIIEDGADLCRYCQTLKLPSSLKTIGIGAFATNANLTELEIPASVEEIRAGAFYAAPLTKLTLHEGLKEIKSTGEYNGETDEIAAFGSSVLKELSIPSSVTKVESKAFANAKFENLKIYGKTALTDFTDYVDGTFTMAEGYTPQFVQGTLE